MELSARPEALSLHQPLFRVLDDLVEDFRGAIFVLSRVAGTSRRLPVITRCIADPRKTIHEVVVGSQANANRVHAVPRELHLHRLHQCAVVRQ